MEASTKEQKLDTKKRVISKRFKDIFRTVTACAIGVAISSYGVYRFNLSRTAYRVEYQGKFIGYVKYMSIAEDAMNTIHSDINNIDSTIQVSDDLTTEKVLVNQDKLISSEYIVNFIEPQICTNNTCYSVLLNDEEVAVVKSEEDAQKFIQDIKDYYANQEMKDGVSSVEVQLKDDIKIIKKITSGANISDLASVVDTLVKGKGTTVAYEVKQGDSTWSIARDNDMKISDITALNPDLNIDKLQLGQKIYFAVSEPYLNVEVKIKQTIDETIAYDIKYVNDDTIYKGQSKVVASGEYGINRVEQEVIKENGKEVSCTILSEEKVKDPVTRVLAKGTKNLMGTGAFVWPAGGYISSSYGYRGNEFHRGLDIAAGYGSPIYAADSGTVSYSGWNGDYGKLIIIDHGNGYQTYYGHCSTLNVSVGQSVSKGQIIGKVGATGQATGSHLHFEVRKNGVNQNPINYLN